MTSLSRRPRISRGRRPETGFVTAGRAKVRVGKPSTWIRPAPNRERSSRSSLVAQRLPIPLRIVCGAYGFCHLEGSDQPFETQLQTAWVSFGEQMWVAFAGPEGGPTKLVNNRSRSLLPGQDGPFSGDPIGRICRAGACRCNGTYPLALSHSVLLCVARQQRGNWLANSLRSLQPQNGPKMPVRFSM